MDKLTANLLARITALERRVSIQETIEPQPVVNSVSLTDGVAAPSAVVGRAIIYVDTSDGDLKVKFGDGTTKVIAADT